VHGYYLRQLASGHADESPCVDAGISNAESTPLLSRTTRRDQVADAYPVDIGFHEQIIPSAYRPGDFTRDGKVDLADFRFFQQCYTGSGVETPPSSCWFFDHDSDFDVDDVDFADWVQWLTGP
jgi:hypothetical protein